MIDFIKNNLFLLLVLFPLILLITSKVMKFIEKFFYKLTGQKIDWLTRILLFNWVFDLIGKIFESIFKRRKY